MRLAAGARFGPYEIVEPIGVGGMGEVYRARDARLSRDVALKVLAMGNEADPDRVRRFGREARAVAALNHPNILAVHDAGSHDGIDYVVSELLEGETLGHRLAQGPLPARKALSLSAQIARGLAAAHDRGIVHRDLKPDNVFLTRDGHAKILDFGLARIIASADGADGSAMTVDERLTAAGTVLGTVGYMSPEQVRGTVGDARSDIFSFGAVLYEMLSGRRAFRGETAADTLVAILTLDPPDLCGADPALPAMAERLVRRCLDKDPHERFQSALDLAFALEALASVPASTPSASGDAAATAPALTGTAAAAARVPEKSIVVLPFTSLSPDPADEFIADGLTAEVIVELSQLRQLTVIARSSSLRLKGTQKDAAAIGRDLGVRYVLEGSVRRAQDAIRVTAQLQDAETDRSLLAERFVGTFADAQDILELLARRIVATMEVSLSAPQSARLKARRIRDAAAFELALRARRLCNNFDLAQIDEALQCTRRAMQIEPDNSSLLALLAYATFTRYNLWLEDEWAMREALQLAQRALALDPEEPLACLTTGTILQGRPGTVADRVEAARWLRHSARLDPSGDAAGWLAFVLACLGRAEAGAALADRALVIAPLDFPLHIWGSWAHLMRGDSRRALDLITRALALQPDDPNLRWQAAYVAAASGDAGRARSLLAAGAAGSGIIGTLTSVLRLALEGDATGAAALADQARHAVDWGWSYVMAAQLALAGAHEPSLDLLEFSVSQGWSQAALPAEHDALMAPLRGDARFEALLERMRCQAASVEVPSVEELYSPSR